MKKILIVGLLLMFFGLSYAQVQTDTTFSYEWNQNTKSWEENERTIISSNGLKTSELVQILEFNDWENYSFSLYFYNDNDQIVKIVEQYWNDIKGQWQDDGKVIYDYNADGTINQILYQNKFNGEYANHRRERHIYDDNGELIEKVIEKNIQDDWVNLRKYDYQYEKNLLKGEKLTIWEDDEWKKLMQTDYSYNQWDQLTSKTRSLITQNESIPFSKETFIFDNAESIHEILHQKFDKRKQEWEYVSSHYIDKGENGNTNLICKYRQKNKWINYCKVERSEDENFDVLDGLANNFYLSVETDKLTSKAIINFDNPFNEIFHVAVYDSYGNKVTSSMLSDGELSFDLSEHNQNQDFYIEFQGSELFSGKFSIN